jgi:hypothetical protein
MTLLRNRKEEKFCRETERFAIYASSIFPVDAVGPLIILHSVAKVHRIRVRNSFVILHLKIETLNCTLNRTHLGFSIVLLVPPIVRFRALWASLLHLYLSVAFDISPSLRISCRRSCESVVHIYTAGDNNQRSFPKEEKFPDSVKVQQTTNTCHRSRSREAE